MGLKSLQLEVPGRFWKSSKCKKKEGLNMAWPVRRQVSSSYLLCLAAPQQQYLDLQLLHATFFDITITGIMKTLSENRNRF